MSKSPKSIGFKATAIALAAATSLTFAAPAFAGSRNHGGGGGQGWGWSGERHNGGHGNYARGYDRGYNRGHSDNNDGLAAVAIIGGVLLGAALLSQPAYSAPPQTVYAPPPDAYYGQAPLQAVPASDVYQTQSGQYCREYQSSARIGGQMQYGYGTACQQPDGSWRVAN